MQRLFELVPGAVRFQETKPSHTEGQEPLGVLVTLWEGAEMKTNVAELDGPAEQRPVLGTQAGGGGWDGHGFLPIRLRKSRCVSSGMG